MHMVPLAALLALVAPQPQPSPARPLAVSAQALVTARIVSAAALRGGRTDGPHQRRRGFSSEGQTLTLIECE